MGRYCPIFGGSYITSFYKIIPLGAVFTFIWELLINFNFFTMQKLLVSAAAFIISFTLFADSIPVNQWLAVKGPDMELPAFSSTENLEGNTFSSRKLFELSPVDISDHYPFENKVFMQGDDFEKIWTVFHANDSGFLSLDKADEAGNSTTYLAAYISADRWMKAELELYSRQMLEVYLNGKSLGTKDNSQKSDADPEKWTRGVELEQGKHLLLIRSFHTSEEESPWQVKGSIKPPEYAEAGDVTFELHPEQGKNINHLLDGIKAGSTTLSPDGKLYAVNFSRILPDDDDTESWTEIRRVSDRKTVHSFRHASISSFSWVPEGNVISYRTTRDGKATIWMHDFDSGEIKSVLEDIEDLGSWSWSADGSFIIFSIREEAPDNEGGMKRVMGMRDRLPGYRNRHFLYKYEIDTGVKERLTHGFLTTSLHDISPCGKKILFSQSRPDYLERPYSKHDIFLMELNTRKTDTLFKDKRRGVSGQFSPDGRQILFTGGPSAFGGLGENIPGGMIANNYDTQAYIYDMERGSIDPFTREFDPSISQAVWSKYNNHIYLVAGDEDFVHLFSYNTSSGSFNKIDTGGDVIHWIRLADSEPVAVFSGSGMSSPPKVSLLDLGNGRYRELENPDSRNFRHVAFGNSMEWDFKNSEGVRIPGRVYLPPGFDESKKYPLIVYYYGGTNPVSRSFGGRYPFNMYAASGYVVYVLQPSGATGFGQEFSAMHVNNWGITVAGEIIRGTKLFLDDHPFIDPERVGCMGASYGGFMTMLLQTHTDMFATAISHAGISSISSYWGEGYWGYGYSAEASAGSFPWNNRELYVDQSPLFSADNITTPLLLLHGDSDTNVPPGESIQLYVALKLLGRPVELVKIEGEDHHILTYSKRIAWSNTKMAWFDKWLKGQSQWWEHLYPEKNL